MNESWGIRSALIRTEVRLALIQRFLSSGRWNRQVLLVFLPVRAQPTSIDGSLERGDEFLPVKRLLNERVGSSIARAGGYLRVSVPRDEKHGRHRTERPDLRQQGQAIHFWHLDVA